jgi:sugar-specific transcriptional regulator TrmB
MHIQGKHLSQLEDMGLFRAEAQIYLTLVQNSGPMRASAIVAAAGVPRGSIYAALTRLTDIGLIEGEAGYGGRFSAVPAQKALSLLIARSRDELRKREKMASELANDLESLPGPAGLNGESELIQVLRDPRVFGERFEQLQEEAKQQIDVFIKAPLLNPRYGNPAQERPMKRGVRCRGLYEKAIMDVPEIKASLLKWITAGEIARVYEGELPHKLAIFDRQSVLVPLVPPQPGRILFLSIRNSQLAASLGMLFDLLWERAEPIACDPPNARSKHSRKNDTDGSKRQLPRARVFGRDKSRSRTI